MTIFSRYHLLSEVVRLCIWQLFFWCWMIILLIYQGIHVYYLCCIWLNWIYRSVVFCNNKIFSIQTYNNKQWFPWNHFNVFASVKLDLLKMMCYIHSVWKYCILLFTVYKTFSFYIILFNNKLVIKCFYLQDSIYSL